MNRKKKINSILKKRVKKMNAKANPSHKPKYISKAERARLAALETPQNASSESEQSI